MGQWWNSKTGQWEAFTAADARSNLPTVRTEEQSATKFKLIIPRAVMDKINWWMRKTDKEVSGFGSLDFDDRTNTFTVKDAILLKQRVGYASAEIDPNAMAKAMFRMKDEPNGLKWHWHSHVNMPVFWSADDMEIIRSLGQRGWIVATVFNYKEERKTAYLTQVALPSPNGSETKPHDIFVNDLETSIVNFVQKDLYDEWDKEYDEHVTQDKPYWEAWRDKDKEKEKGETKPTVYVAPKIESYRDNGYADVTGFRLKTIYNPCFDSSLITPEEQMDEIDSMTYDMIEFLLERSPMFQSIHKKYLERKVEFEAKQPKLPTTPYSEGFDPEDEEAFDGFHHFT